MTPSTYIAIGLTAYAVVMSLLVVGLADAAIETTIKDPELTALKAERARPRRERRPYAKIDADAKRIVNERLARAVRG